MIASMYPTISKVHDTTLGSCISLKNVRIYRIYIYIYICLVLPWVHENDAKQLKLVREINNLLKKVITLFLIEENMSPRHGKKSTHVRVPITGLAISNSTFKR
jgi:hypothetical protein